MERFTCRKARFSSIITLYRCMSARSFLPLEILGEQGMPYELVSFRPERWRVPVRQEIPGV